MLQIWSWNGESDHFQVTSYCTWTMSINCSWVMLVGHHQAVPRSTSDQELVWSPAPLRNKIHELHLQLVLYLSPFEPYTLRRNYIKRIQWERSPSGKPSHHPACRSLLALYLEHSLCSMKVEVVVKAILPMEGTRDQMEHRGPSNAYTTCKSQHELEMLNFCFCHHASTIWKYLICQCTSSGDQ